MESAPARWRSGDRISKTSNRFESSFASNLAPHGLFGGKEISGTAN
jgi:hypothetical protein